MQPNYTRRGSCPEEPGVWHVMDDDGANLKRLTSGAANSNCPCWSPDGKKIAFARNLPNGAPQIFAMNADGSDQKSLTPDRVAADPAWSPDGTKIAYAGFIAGRGYHLFVMDADGKNPKQLSASDNTFGYVFPAWSPDGKQIAFSDLVKRRLEIFVCDADGANLKQATATGNNTFAAWSPDGKSILFRHVAGPGKGPIYRVDLNDAGGENEKALDAFRAEGWVAGGRHVWKAR